MRFLLEIDGSVREVSVDADPPRFRLNVEGNEIRGKVLVRYGTVVVKFPERTMTVELGPNGLLVNGKARTVRAKAITSSLERSQAAFADREFKDTCVVEVHAPMPGKIVSLLTREGSTVSRGDPLLVLEAMKMQNEVVAPRSGCVRNLAVEEGMQVLPAQILLIIE